MRPSTAPHSGFLPTIRPGSHLVFALVLALATVPALAGKSVAECRVFADRSAAQLREAETRNCGFAAGWNGTWQQNYDYCRRAESESTDKIGHRPAVMMRMCTAVCPGYAAAAVDDIRIATEGGCIRNGQVTGVSGPIARWSGNYQAHFAWCMSGVSEATISRERDVRATEAPRCKICNDYAATTVRLAIQQKERQCDYDAFHSGHQWSTDPNLHFQHCMGYPIDAVRQWTQGQTNERDNLLSRCPSLQTKAMCNRHATRAIEQRAAATSHGCALEGGRLANSRWNADREVHFKGCLLNPETAGPEQQARDAYLQECGAISRGSPPMMPPRQGMNCRFGAVLRPPQCYTAPGEAATNWDPTGMSPACGLGETADEAESNGLLAYQAPGINLTVKKDAGAGECEYSAQHISACSCDAGLNTRSMQLPRKQLKPADVEKYNSPSVHKRFPVDIHQQKRVPPLPERQPSPALHR